MAWCKKCGRMWERCDKRDLDCIKAQPRKHPSDGGEVRVMALADGYVLARRPGRMPFVIAFREWQKWLPFREST